MTSSDPRKRLATRSAEYKLHAPVSYADIARDYEAALEAAR